MMESLLSTCSPYDSYWITILFVRLLQMCFHIHIATSCLKRSDRDRTVNAIQENEIHFSRSVAV